MTLLFVVIFESLQTLHFVKTGCGGQTMFKTKQSNIYQANLLTHCYFNNSPNIVKYKYLLKAILFSPY